MLAWGEMAFEKQVNNLASVAPAYLSLRYVRTSIEGAEHGERDGWQGFKGQTGCPPGSPASIENVRPFDRFGATIADSAQSRRGSRTGKNWLLESGGAGRRRRVDPPRFRARGADFSSVTATVVSFFRRSGMPPLLIRPHAHSCLNAALTQIVKTWLRTAPLLPAATGDVHAHDPGKTGTG